MCCCVYDNKLPEPVDLERVDASAMCNFKTGRLTEKKSQTNSIKARGKCAYGMLEWTVILIMAEEWKYIWEYAGTAV